MSMEHPEKQKNAVKSVVDQVMDCLLYTSFVHRVLALLLFGLQSRQVGLQTSLFPMRRSEDRGRRIKQRYLTDFMQWRGALF